MNSQEFRALQEAYNQVYDEAYKSLPHEKMIAKSNKFDKQYKTGPTRTDAEYKSTTDALRRRADTHLATKFHDPKQSQEKSAANKNRPENEKRSKTVSNEPKRFPNRLRRADGQGIKDSYEYELDENRMASRMGKMPSAPAKVGKATHSIKDLTPSKPPSPEEKAKARKALGIGEEIDLYDIILSHLLDEGYADTQEAAEAIMVNMSEDWRESIVEGAAGAFVPSKVDDSNNRRDMLKNRYGQDVSPRIPGPSGGGQFEKPSSNPAGALRLAKTSSKGDTKTA